MDDFRRFARHLPTPLLLVSADGRVLDANAAALKALKRSSDELPCDFAALVDGRDADLAGYLGSCARTTAPVPGAFRAVVAGASVRFRCEGWRVSASADDDRSLLRFWPSEDENRFVMLRQNLEELNQEVRRRQELERELRESEARFRRLYETGILGVLFSSVDGSLVDGNEAALSVLGYTKAEVRAGGVRWRDLTPPEYRSADDRALEELKAQGFTTPFEKEYVRKDGSRVPVLVGGALVDPNVFDRTVVFVLDISDRKRAEAQREAVLVSLREAVRLSELTMGILGHDLRNPLNAITMAADSLLRRPEGDRPTRPLVRILSSAERMNRMIEQLLDVTRVRMGGGIELERSERDLAAIVRSVIDELELAYPERELELTRRGVTTGQWDQGRLEQVVSNLVGNALHHGSSEAAVRVTVDGSSAEHVVLEVQNGGVIPAELMLTLFEPFAKARAKPASGLGLGLYIAERVVRAHGGSVAVRSNDDDGTVFSVRLPRSTLEDPALEGQPEASRPHGGARLERRVDVEQGARLGRAQAEDE